MRGIALIAASVAILGTAGMANAADLYNDTPVSYKDAPYSPAPIWSGMYVGGHIGGAWTDRGSSKASKEICTAWDKISCRKKECIATAWEDAKDVKFQEEDDDDVNLIGGVQIGYNWQVDSKVFGIEADVSFGDGFDYLASLRARLGHSFGDLLVYATAGVAFAGLDDGTIKYTYDRRFVDPDKVYSKGGGDDDMKVGFVVGGGAEYKLDANWSVGVEGLYYMFDDNKDTYDYTIGYGRHAENRRITNEDDNDFLVVRARVNYHFQEEYAPLK